MATVNPKRLLKILFVIVALLVSANESYAQIKGSYRTLSSYFPDRKIVFKRNGQFYLKASKDEYKYGSYSLKGNYIKDKDTLVIFENSYKYTDTYISHSEVFNPTLKDTLRVRIVNDSSYYIEYRSLRINRQLYPLDTANGNAELKVIMRDSLRYMFVNFPGHSSPLIKISNPKCNDITIRLLDIGVAFYGIMEYDERILIKGDTLFVLELSGEPNGYMYVKGKYQRGKTKLYKIFEQKPVWQLETIAKSRMTANFKDGVYRIDDDVNFYGGDWSQFPYIRITKSKYKKRAMFASGELVKIDYAVLSDSERQNNVMPIDTISAENVEHTAYLCRKKGDRLVVKKKIEIERYRRYKTRKHFILIKPEVDGRHLVFEVRNAEYQYNLWRAPIAK